MKIFFKLFTISSFFLASFISKADTYPVNKNIDVKHYAFELSLSDNTNEIIGTAKVTVNFKKAGMQNFRLDLINKTSARQDKGMVVNGVHILNAPLNPYI